LNNFQRILHARLNPNFSAAGDPFSISIRLDANRGLSFPERWKNIKKKALSFTKQNILKDAGKYTVIRPFFQTRQFMEVGTVESMNR